MANRFRNRSIPLVGARPAKRASVWLEGKPAITTIATADTASLIFVLTTAEKAMRPFTIVRFLFTLGWKSDQAAASENQQIAMGAAIVSEQASAIGVTAVPTPINDMGSELFFAYTLEFSAVEFISAVGVEPGYTHQSKIDSKAMRKVSEGQDLAVTLETGPGSSGVATVLGGRLLIKLH